MVVLAIVASLALVVGVVLGFGWAQMRAKDHHAEGRAILLRTWMGQDLRFAVPAPANDAPPVDSGWRGGTLTTMSQRAALASAMGLSWSCETTAAALGLKLVAAPELLSTRFPYRIDADLRLLQYTPGPSACHDILTACAGEAFRQSGLEWTPQDAQALAEELMQEQPAVARARHKMI